MIIKNVGSKIINVGHVVLMPDAEMTADEAIKSNPALQAFEKMGFIKFIDEAVIPEPVAEPEVEADPAPKAVKSKKAKAKKAKAEPVKEEIKEEAEPVVAEPIIENNAAEAVPEEIFE